MSAEAVENAGQGKGAMWTPLGLLADPRSEAANGVAKETPPAS